MHGKQTESMNTEHRTTGYRAQLLMERIEVVKLLIKTPVTEDSLETNDKPTVISYEGGHHIAGWCTAQLCMWSVSFVECAVHVPGMKNLQGIPKFSREEAVLVLDESRTFCAPSSVLCS